MTPVRANRVTLSHLLEGECGPLAAEQETVLHMLSENNFEIERLLTMLVSLYRFQNGMAALRKEKYNFSSLVEPVIEELSSKAKKHDISIKRKCHSQNPMVECDFVELQRRGSKRTGLDLWERPNGKIYQRHCHSTRALVLK